MRAAKAQPANAQLPPLDTEGRAQRRTKLDIGSIVHIRIEWGGEHETSERRLRRGVDPIAEIGKGLLGLSSCSLPATLALTGGNIVSRRSCDEGFGLFRRDRRVCIVSATPTGHHQAHCKRRKAQSQPACSPRNDV